MRRTLLFCTLIVIACASLVLTTRSLKAQAPQATTEAAEFMVPMRDGIKLATDVYLPGDSAGGDSGSATGRYPVILIRTPYSKGMRGQATPWLKEGYAVVLQDCRGRFRSQGRYLPFMDDHADGYDTVEWIAAQKWSNQKIGLYGGSAMGITANQASYMTPPHLTAMYVMVAPASAYQQAIYTGGIFRKEINEGWLKSQGATDVLAETLKHYKQDGYWDIREGKLHWAKVQVPVYNQGGWYDVFLQGNIDNYVGLQHQGGKGARGNQKLLMGPWAHGQVEEVKYPANSGAPAEEPHRWFAYWLQGKDNGIMREPPVKYYAMGDVTDPKAPGNEWRTSSDWPPAAKTTPLYFAEKGTLSRTAPSSSNPANTTSTYVYDAAKPVPTIGGSNLTIKKGPMDQRAIGERPDVLKFSTTVLDAPLEITGPVKVELFSESDAPDTDWIAKLIDVYPDGTERLILDSGLRARFRNGFDREVMMEKRKVYRFDIDLWSTSIILNKGHRLAVHISSSNDPRFDPNPNTGKPLRADGEERPAKNTIHYSRSHPSRILLPVIVSGSGSQAGTVSNQPGQ